MAKQLVFTGTDGVAHQDGYWRVTRIENAYEERRADVILMAWHDRAARVAGCRPVLDTTTWYRVTGDLYDTYFGGNAEKEHGLREIAYRIVAERAPVGVSETDEDGNPRPPAEYLRFLTASDVFEAGQAPPVWG